MINRKKAGSFFLEFQKKNVLRLLQGTMEKIINQWLIDDEQKTKLQSLQQLSEMDIISDEFPNHLAIPDFVMNLWLDPHSTVETLENHISKAEIRNLIKETAKEIELVTTHQKAPDYS